MGPETVNETALSATPSLTTSALCKLDASDALVRNVGAKMAVRKGLRIRTIASRGEQKYNYLGTLVRAHLYYNEDNRFSFSPIRRTGDGERRAILRRSGPDSSPSCRKPVATSVCIPLDETVLVDDFALDWPIVSSPGRGKWQVAILKSCPSFRSPAKPPKSPDGADHFDED